MSTKSIINHLKQTKNTTGSSDLNTQLPNLTFCVIMDLLGMATYALPFTGEWGDMIWGPVSAMIFYRSFRGMTGAVGSVVSLIEELVPFLDFVPTFTIGYFYTKHQIKKNTKAVK
ncbi:MAG: hypothetical protein ACK5L7_04955 [Paludibacteraceae bacterium]